MFFTLLPISTDLRDVQALKLHLPMLVTLLGISMEVREEQP